MTDDQIDEALAVCEAANQEQVCPAMWNDSETKAFIYAASEPLTGYEAALRELKAARGRIAELEAAAKAVVAMGTVET